MKKLKLVDILDDNNSITIDNGDRYISSHNLVLLASLMLHEPGTKTINLKVKRQKGTTSALCQTAVLSCMSMPDINVNYFSGISNLYFIKNLKDYCYDILKDIKIEFNIDTIDKFNKIIFSNGSSITFINNNSDLIGRTAQVSIFDNLIINGEQNKFYEKFDQFFIKSPGATSGTRCIINVEQLEDKI